MPNDAQLSSTFHTAARRRGRFVFKFGAALYLFELSELEVNKKSPRLQKPGELSVGMERLWGHLYISPWYARHHPEGQRLCQSVRAAGHADGLLLDVAVPGPGDADGETANSHVRDAHVIRLSSYSKTDLELRERLQLAMEGSWKEELGWRALSQPFNLQPVLYGFRAPLVLPSSQFLLVPAGEGKTASTDPDVSSLVVMIPSNTGSNGSKTRRSEVTISWDMLDALHDRMGRGFTDCWNVLRPFFREQAAYFVPAEGFTADPMRPVSAMADSPTLKPASTTDSGELLFTTEHEVVPVLWAEEEEAPRGPRQDQIDALSLVYAQALKVLRRAPTSGADDAENVAAVPNRGLPSAAQGWFSLDAVLRRVRPSLPLCFRHDGLLPQSVPEDLALLVLLLRLDLTQQLQVMVMDTPTIGAAAASSAHPISLRAAWGHKDAALDGTVRGSHPIAPLKTASAEVSALRRPASLLPPSAANAPEAVQALLSSLAGPASTDTAVGWQELVASVRTWGQEVGCQHQSRFCPSSKPFVTLLPPSVSGRLATIAGAHQLAASGAITTLTAQVTLDMLDDAVRPPLSAALASLPDPAAQRAALEAALQHITPSEWSAAALSASGLIVAHYTAVDKTAGGFNADSSALVPIQDGFIDRHGKVSVHRVCPFLRKDAQTGQVRDARGDAEASRDVWLLSVYTVNAACCPRNASLISVDMLYKVRKLKAQTTLPLLRVPAPEWWEADANETVGDGGGALTAIATHPLSLPTSALRGHTSTTEAAGPPLPPLLFVAPPRLPEDAAPTEAKAAQAATPATNPKAATMAAAKAATPPLAPHSERLPTPPDFPTAALHACVARFQRLSTAAQSRILAHLATTPEWAAYAALNAPVGAEAGRMAPRSRVTLSEAQLAVWRGLAGWAALCTDFHQTRPFAHTPLSLWLPLDKTPPAIAPVSKPLFNVGYQAALKGVRREMKSGPHHAFAPLFFADGAVVAPQCVPASVSAAAQEDATPPPPPSTVAMLIGAEQVLALGEAPVADVSARAMAEETPSSLFFVPWTDSPLPASPTPTTTPNKAGGLLSAYQCLATPAVALSSPGQTQPVWPASAFLECATTTTPPPAEAPVVLMMGTAALAVSWSAEQLVDTLLCPPLFACLRQHSHTGIRTGAGTVSDAAAEDQMLTPDAHISALQQALRWCLVQALADLETMERYEFIGDALLDYVVSLRTLSLTDETGNPLWDDTGSITTQSTNLNLASALPGAIRHFLASAHAITNEKRCADVVESLFGALVAALWSWPQKHGLAPDVATLFRCTAVLMEIFDI